MKKSLLLPVWVVGFLFLWSCGSRQAATNDEIIIPKASVKITTLAIGNIEDQLVLNGKTVFLKKNDVVSPIPGYITAVKVKFGDKVQEGTVLFEIQTRENKAMQQSGNSGNDFGKIAVLATTSGIINEPITLGVGAYVTEGSRLCTLADNKDLLVLVNVPYEYHQLIKQGTLCKLFLPDNSQLDGSVFQIRPFISEISQTQEVLIKIKGNRQLPENMNLTASFLKAGKADIKLLPKKAILTNETQNEFWVMKIVHDSLAVIVPVETGIKNDSLVEITSLGLNPGDIVVLEGGYGLPDSSIVNIEK